MNRFLELFLGILTAVGGFVEVGELTFALNAGSRFGYSLLWMFALGTIGIMAYCEMAGRVAAVRQQPVFNLVRERIGLHASLVALVASLAVNLLTCAAEIGGIALLWQLLSGWPYRLLVLGVFVALLTSMWFLSFAWIERLFGLGGLLMLVLLFAAAGLRPDWSAVGAGLVPQVPALPPHELLVYAFFCVALLSSIMLPYETYFYSSGVIEDGWTAKDITLNRVIVVVGFALGSLLGISAVVIGARYLGPLHVEAGAPGTAAMATSLQYGRTGVVLALTGMCFAFGGAAVETALSSAYSLAQFAGWPWGKRRAPRQASRFALAWVAMLVAATALIVTGIDPVKVVECSIVFSVVILPLTYLPLLLVARDREVMGAYANGPLSSCLGWTFLVLVTLAAIAAIPLFVLTHAGRG